MAEQAAGHGGGVLLASSDQAQRRNHARIDGCIPARLRWGGRGAPATILDISEGGARLVTTGRACPDRGEEVDLAFKLEGEVVTVSGVVVRRRPVDEGMADLGVRFEGIASALADRLRRHVFATELQLRAAGLR